MIISFLTLLINVVLFSSTANDFIHISITDKNVSTIPRDIHSIPIDGIYNGFDNSIYVTFKQDIGYTDITVTNCTTSESVFEYADSLNGQVVIQTSGTPGDYLLQIETESGDCYEGEFTVE